MNYFVFIVLRNCRLSCGVVYLEKNRSPELPLYCFPDGLDCAVCGVGRVARAAASERLAADIQSAALVIPAVRYFACSGLHPSMVVYADSVVFRGRNGTDDDGSGDDGEIGDDRNRFGVGVFFLRDFLCTIFQNALIENQP